MEPQHLGLAMIHQHDQIGPIRQIRPGLRLDSVDDRPIPLHLGGFASHPLAGLLGHCATTRTWGLHGFELPPDPKLELLLPRGDKRPIQDFLNKNKSGALKSVKPLGIRTLDEKSKIGAHNKPVVFLHPKDCGGVLVELEQE
ncbi:unnamed protein product, partial [Mesorhabditis belari]|uniref:Uncharacterized protein n=1 Tax=Mesorhabditis belari TaxID=2138241 RepID=A0AAF3J8L1_9BILA